MPPKPTYELVSDYKNDGSVQLKQPERKFRIQLLINVPDADWAAMTRALASRDKAKVKTLLTKHVGSDQSAKKHIAAALADGKAMTKGLPPDVDIEELAGSPNASAMERPAGHAVRIHLDVKIEEDAWDALKPMLKPPGNLAAARDIIVNQLGADEKSEPVLQLIAAALS